MSSVFKSLTEFYGSSTTSEDRIVDGDVFIGQVLTVGKSTTSVEIGGATVTPTINPYLIGVIRFIKAGKKTQPEKTVQAIAYPLDRSSYRLPFVGEEVLLVKKKGTYYYLEVVTPSYFMPNNIEAFLMQDAFQASGDAKITVDVDLQAQRFEIDNDFQLTTLQKKTGVATRVREGETILEGRMGGILKLTHTNTTEGIWDNEKQIANIGNSIDGDPMMIIKANRRRKEFVDVGSPLGLLEDDDINTDDSSFYLTTTQKVPMAIASSTNMSSWSVSITKGKFNQSNDPVARLQELIGGDTYDKNAVVAVNVMGTGQLAGAGGGTWQQTAADFISKKEGFTELAAWDVNHFRAGYGSDQIYKNGVLTVVTQGMTVTREEALNTLRDYSIPAYAQQIAKDLGNANWEKLSNNQKAALTSLGYNVGKYYINAKEYGKKIKAYIEANDFQKAGETIFTDGPKYAGGELLQGLVKRRQDESNMFLT